MPTHLPRWTDSPPVHALAAAYSALVTLRNAAFDLFPFLSKHATHPVVSVGGVHCGGTGKTPMTRLVVDRLVRLGWTAAVLSRGYGRHSRRSIIAPPGTRFSWEEIGDEPALLSGDGVWLGVGPNRVRNARGIAQLAPGRTVFVLDDGFQHRRIHREFDIVCLPGTKQEDRLLPAGMLREPLRNLSRAHAVCLIGHREEEPAMRLARGRLLSVCEAIPVYLLFQTPRSWVNAASGSVQDAPPLSDPVALTGIARPERFLTMIRDLGITPVRSVQFADHHPFSARDFAALPEAAEHGIITTEKDAQRLATVDLVQRPAIWYLRIDLEFSEKGDEERFVQAMADKLNLGTCPEKEESR